MRRVHGQVLAEREWLMERGVATSLRGDDADAAGPIEPPERIRKPSNAKWYALVGCAFAGATAILIASGIGNPPGAAAGAPATRSAHTGAHTGDPHTITYAVQIYGLPAVGPSDPKVTLVAVYDYACPRCEQLRAELDALRTRYRNDLRIVYKPYVASPVSAASVVAACAAARQGRFELFDDRLWTFGAAARSSNPVALPDEAELAVIARDLGLESKRFDVDRAACEATIANGRRELEALGVTEPPVVFVNGRRFDRGAVQLDDLVAEEIATAKRRIREGTEPERYFQEWVIDLGRTER